MRFRVLFAVALLVAALGEAASVYGAKCNGCPFPKPSPKPTDPPAMIGAR